MFDISRFVNSKKSFKLGDVSYEFGKRLNSPAIKCYGSVCEISHMDENGVERRFLLDYILLENLFHCPDFEMRGNRILSPITVAKDNKNKIYAVVIGSEEYDKIHSKILETPLDSLKKGVQYWIKFNSGEYYKAGQITLGLNSKTISSYKSQANNQLSNIYDKLTNDDVEGIYGVYLGSFQGFAVKTTLRRNYTDKNNSMVVIQNGISDKKLVFYLPDYDEFIIVPVGLRKLLILDRSKTYKNIPANKMSTHRIDDTVAEEMWEVCSDIKDLFTASGQWRSREATFFSKEAKDAFYKKLKKYDGKTLKKLEEMGLL